MAKYEFQTEVNQLLKLIIHSLYSWGNESAHSRVAEILTQGKFSRVYARMNLGYKMR